ncbi:MAG: Ig domain-containing protein, partial [Thermoleophilia bacterium]|nr:Ig domain-containing protein [Thermoleophilia bacterium]
VDAPLRIAGTPAAVATLGQAYSASFAASGGTGPYTFALATGTLPAGLTIAAATGGISGIPTTVGSSSGISVKAVDAAGRTAVSDLFAIEVGTLVTVVGTASSFATAGAPYSAQFSVSGGKAPYAWTLASGTLPPGLSLDVGTGLVAGTPTTIGSYPGIQIRVADASGRSALSSIFGISVSSSLSIAGTPSISATVGQPYSAQFTATGGAGAKVFSLATGQLPAGLTFDTATGLISGVPTAKGFAPSIAVRVRDETNSAATAQAFDLYVSDPLVVSGIPTPDAIVGAAYSGNAAVAGGRPAYAWTLDAGTLPPGLQLSAVTGVVSGTPTTPGTASGLRLRATDVDGRTGVTAAFAITVAAPLTIAGQAGPGTVGATYVARFAADGGTMPYAYEVVGAALPAGLTLDAATGTISGQPTAASAGGTMQMRVTDAKGRTASTTSFSIDVREAFRLVGSNLGPATIGLAYSGMMAPAGGRGPFVLSLAAGSLPPGLTLEPGTGVIAGTPTAPGSYAGIVIAGVDADGRTARSEAFGIDVADGISIAGIPPQPATVGVPYSFAFTARGGQAPYTFALTGGNLPGGMTLDGGTGGMGGSPNRAGMVSGLTVTAMDRARRTAASLPFTIDVRDPVSVTGTPPLVATTGRPYTASFAAAGGRGPFAFAMVGTLPAGLTLNATSGTITGSATTIGDVAGLRVRATDQDGRVGTSDPFAISVAAPLILAGTPSPSADVGAPYAAKFTAAGGKQPYA